MHKVNLVRLRIVPQSYQMSNL